METIKVKVAYSRWSIVTTCVILGLFFILCWIKVDGSEGWLWLKILRVIMAGLVLGGGYYGPVSVELDDQTLKINRGHIARTINIADIVRVEPHSRTMVDVRKRICGSCGYMGYWGWFSSPSIGRYFAYVGRWRDAFLIELKSGRKYVISCKESDRVVTAINDRLAVVCGGE
ncbi:MAG: PH domain-containing protein [Muribaculaceae bacterium]|nr:PH domain-containing protein [Muribaculaceae bacterium]